MKPVAIIILLGAIIASGCSAPRYLSYDNLKQYHYIGRINQNDNTIIQVNHPKEVRALKSNEYLELYYPRKMDAENKMLLISIHADEIQDIFVSKSNNPNALKAREIFWELTAEILLDILFFW